MKTIYLARHAKSSWDNLQLEDFERPLNNRGRRDAPFIGSVLKKLKIKPDAIISSPATRASTTARIIANNISYPLEHIYYNEIIYGASDIELVDLIGSILETTKSAMIVGHNPGLTDLANYLTKENIVNIPTCGVFGVKIDIDNWKKINHNCGKLEFFEYPKKYKY